MTSLVVFEKVFHTDRMSFLNMCSCLDVFYQKDVGAPPCDQVVEQPEWCVVPVHIQFGVGSDGHAALLGFNHGCFVCKMKEDTEKIRYTDRQKHPCLQPHTKTAMVF